MSGYSREIVAATRALCGGGGALRLPQLRRLVRQRCGVTDEEFLFIVERCSRFALVRGPEGDPTVVARTSLRLCRRYGKEGRCGGCQQLHLCKFFVFGTCRFGKGR